MKYAKTTERNYHIFVGVMNGTPRKQLADRAATERTTQTALCVKRAATTLTVINVYHTDRNNASEGVGRDR